MENNNEKEQKPNQQEETKKPETSGNTKNDLTKEDIPESTNENTGVPGSGQRQDSN